jgi:hypothetical protein
MEPRFQDPRTAREKSIREVGVIAASLEKRKVPDGAAWRPGPGGSVAAERLVPRR